MSALPASWFSRVKGYLAAKELVEANVEMPPPPGGDASELALSFRGDNSVSPQADTQG